MKACIRRLPSNRIWLRAVWYKLTCFLYFHLLTPRTSKLTKLLQFVSFDKYYYSCDVKYVEGALSVGMRNSCLPIFL